MGGMGYGHMAGFRRDRSIMQHQLQKGLIKRIYGFSAPYRKVLVLFMVLVIVDAAASTANPLIYRVILNDGIVRHHASLIIWLAVLLGLLAILDAVLGIAERMISARVGGGLVLDMRSQVFGHVSRMPIAFFTRAQTGALVSRLNADVTGAQQAFTDILSNVVSNLVTVTLVLAAMFYLSWQITLVALVILPVFIFPAKHVGKRLQAITRESYGLNAEMTTMMTERFNVAGALLVKIFGRLDSERSNFDQRATRVRDIGITQAMLARIFFAAMMLTAALATALVYGWGGFLAERGTLSVGTVVALASYLTRLYGPLTQLSNVQLDVMSTLVSFDRIFEVLDLPPMIDERENPIPLARGPLAVAFEDVSFSYPLASEVSLASLESIAVPITENQERVEVLHNVSFVASPGQMIALVGHSGAGKTTIGQLTARLYDVTSGVVKIGGYDVRNLSLESLHAAIGIVTQDAHLFHDTIRANLLYAKPDAAEHELIDALQGAHIWDLVGSLQDGMDTVVGDRGYRLSGGEKQRIAIARLLLKAPDVVVLDEATAHLDSESELAVQLALEKALAGRTSIVIAHRLSTVRAADMILVLEAGRIVERGRHEELLRNGELYAELYRTQFRPET
jgi:ATP-binding cassette, subfamily B, bacterial